ncbi:hypothetical protein GCK72_011864 [Caenorhabditis remanei]|uniref:Uncharacterized protein n=1 Tax=Caenorhabditis remanei TaxID=31234 RepID=A0A6A5H8Q1_CAERE|nr:hypothetical protein GCK72_011864 [Caenorhabditis remanei]KAF1763597.1 hypothetical protein GCK72_011864 [Caenorhabditis remanei]
MSRPKVGAIGALILVSFILTAVATFTKNWIVWNTGFFSYSVGVVPYNQNRPSWFLASAIMMYISFALFFPLFLIYFHASYKVHHHGCCHSIRHSFNGISLICSLVVMLEAVAFILMAVNSSSYMNVFYPDLGSSAYIALSSAIVATIAMSLSGHVARHHCH